MHNARRSAAFWIIVVFLAVSIVLMLAGQTMAVFNYDLAVRLGLQESLQQVGDFGVRVNRAFGASDNIVYVPLMIVSLIGLFMKKRWSLLTTAAFAGVSAYWTSTIGSMLLFLPGAPGYSFAPGLEIWLFVGVYFVFGVWALIYLAFRGNDLIR